MRNCMEAAESFGPKHQKLKQMKRLDRSGSVATRASQAARRTVQRYGWPRVAGLLGLCIASITLLSLYSQLLSSASSSSMLRARLENAEDAGGALKVQARGARTGHTAKVGVLLTGQPVAKPLSKSYPGDVANKFACDLPSLRYQCDLNTESGCATYPQLFPMGDLLANWSPENTTAPEKTFSSLCRFNMSSPYEAQLAQVFHQMEVPFIVYDVPELTRAGKLWTPDYLSRKLQPQEVFKVHSTKDSHYLFFAKSVAQKDQVAPYETNWWTYQQFLQQTADAERQTSEGSARFHYLQLKMKDLNGRASFIYDDLPFLDPSPHTPSPYGDFFIRNGSDALGNCRFGMRGIITEGHIDGGLNMIAMVQGAKRYIVAPPSVCGCLGLRTEGPSARHTETDWSQPTLLSGKSFDCPATEVVVNAGDVLYLPSYWYHHIIALDRSIQCNMRSGSVARDDVKDFLARCGL